MAFWVRSREAAVKAGMPLDGRTLDKYKHRNSITVTVGTSSNVGGSGRNGTLG